MICVVCTLTGSVFGVIQAFSVNMTMYTILRTLSGMFYFAVFSPAFALSMFVELTYILSNNDTCQSSTKFDDKS